MRTFRPVIISIVALVILFGLFTPAALAQDWRGMGRIAGKVADENQKPLEGVVIKALLPGRGGTQAKTNRKGEWVLGGIAAGQWNLDFTKEGYETRQISVSVSDYTRVPPIEIVLAKATSAVDPNVEIREELIEGADLIAKKQYSEARAIYEELLAKYPEAYQLHPLIARTYYAENQHDKAIEHLRMALEKDPQAIEVKLLLGNVLIERGKAEEGQQILALVDETQIKDPTTFVNVGIVFLNQERPADAVLYFDKAINRFPQQPDAYYYRGLARLQLSSREAEKAADLQRGAKADMQKFLELAPNAPEAATAKKILDQLK